MKEVFFILVMLIEVFATPYPSCAEAEPLAKAQANAGGDQQMTYEQKKIIKKVLDKFIEEGREDVTKKIPKTEDIKVTKTVYLEHGKVVEPKNIVRTNDGGFVIVGSLNTQAWATRVDSEGNVKWRYTPPPREGLPKGRQNYIFSSAAVMSDDSVFLCTGAPEIKGFSSGLLTHIDKEGKVLSVQYLRPTGFEGGGFASCMAWGGGLVIVGGTHSVPPAEEKRFYWISAYDENGKFKWEKLEPLSNQKYGSGNDGSPIQVTDDGGFIFASPGVGFLETEVVRVKPNGDILKNVLKGGFKLVMPTQKETDIQLVSIRTNSLIRITLNNDLQEINRVTEKHTDGNVHMPYSLPDKSLLLFGSLIEGGHSGYAWVMKLDPKKREQMVNLAPDKQSYWIDAAVPTGRAGEFVSVRSAIKHGGLEQVLTSEQLENVRLGVALDFIKIK